MNKIIIMVLMIFMSVVCFADDLLPSSMQEAACSGQWIISTGISDMSKGVYIAKKRATMDAYRDAVNRGADMQIEDFTQAKMMTSMSKVYSIVTKKSKGFITTYEVMDAVQVSSDRFEVTIRACVVDDAKGVSLTGGLAMFVNMLGPPKILFVIGQSQYNEKAPPEKLSMTEAKDENGVRTSKTITAEGLASKSDSLEIRTVETSLAEYFRQYGYEVMTSDDLANRDIAEYSRIVNARKGIGGYAIQLARDAGVDIVITGSISYTVDDIQVFDAESDRSTSSLNIKAVMPGSGKTVGIYNEQAKAISVTGSQLIAREESIEKVSAILGEKLAWDIPKYLVNEEREIEINLQNVQYNHLRQIKQSLKNQKEILDVVDKGRWKKTSQHGGDVHLSVRTSYLGVTVDDILNTLEQIGFSPQVEEANDYYIKVSLI